MLLVAEGMLYAGLSKPVLGICVFSRGCNHCHRDVSLWNQLYVEVYYAIRGQVLFEVGLISS